MPPRARMALTLLVGAAAAAVLAVSLATRGGATSTPGPAAFEGAARPPGIPPVDFALRDEDGRTVRLGQYAGRVTVVAFLDTHTRGTPFLLAEQIRGALDQIGPNGAPVALAVSVDPHLDTPARARRFLAATSLRGRMHLLLGPRAALAPIWRAFGAGPRSFGGDAASVVLIDRGGRQRDGFAASTLTPEALAHDVRLLDAESPPSPQPPRRML